MPANDSDDELGLPEPRGQLVLDLHHEPSHAEADFLVWDGNRLAFQHITAFPNWPGPLTLLVGPAKAGKTHLARIWAERSEAIAAGPEDVARLSTQGGTRPVLVENADRAEIEEADLFHLLNQSMRDNRPLLLTAREGVADWRLTTDDVRSRLRLAAQFTVSAANDMQLSQMLVKLFSDRQMNVDPKIVSYLVTRMERSPQEAVALVTLIDRLTLSQRSAVTRKIAADALRQREEGRDRQDMEDLD